MSETPYQTALRELEASVEDIRPSDIVSFSEPLRSALNFSVRTGLFSLTEFSEKLGLPLSEASRLADILVKRNLFEVTRVLPGGETYYQARLTSMTRPFKRPPSDIWKKIE